MQLYFTAHIVYFTKKKRGVDFLVNLSNYIKMISETKKGNAHYRAIVLKIVCKRSKYPFGQT